MLLLHGDADAESDKMPDKELMDQMQEYNRQIVNSGTLLDAEGFHTTSSGVRVYFPPPPANDVNKPGPKEDIAVTKGPFKYPGLPSAVETRAHAKEFEGQRPMCGYWQIKAKDLDEAVEVVKRGPLAGCYVEIRLIAEGCDFYEELLEEEKGWRKQMEVNRQAQLSVE